MKYSTRLANELRVALFDRDDQSFKDKGDPVFYRPKDGRLTEAKETWAIHGVCLECHRLSLSVARCADCGTAYAEDDLQGVKAERMVAAQLFTAARIIRESR